MWPGYASCHAPTKEGNAEQDRPLHRRLRTTPLAVLHRVLSTLQLSAHRCAQLCGGRHLGKRGQESPLTKLFRPTLLALLRGVMSAPRLDFLACPGPGAAGASACSSAVSSREASLQGSSLTFGVDPMSCFMRASICRRAAEHCQTLHGCQLCTPKAQACLQHYLVPTAAKRSPMSGYSHRMSSEPKG